MNAKQTPLIDLLKNVPRTARLLVEENASTRSIPVGKLCADAVEELERAQALARTVMADMTSHDGVTPIRKREMGGWKMTPQQAYEKRYAHIDGGQHTWDAAPPHIKEQWLAAWTIGWAMGEEAGREACAKAAEDYADYQRSFGDEYAELRAMGALEVMDRIRARGEK